MARTAWRAGADALRINPLRTALSTLGVIIGVASLVAVLSLGDGMERTAREQFVSTTGLQAISITSRTTEQVRWRHRPRRYRGSVLAAAAASLVIGLLFGTYPARRAAALSPIDAIRHE